MGERTRDPNMPDGRMRKYAASLCSPCHAQQQQLLPCVFGWSFHARTAVLQRLMRDESA